MTLLLNTDCWVPFRVSDSAGLGWGLQICISSKFAGAAMIVVWGPHFENHWSRQMCEYVRVPVTIRVRISPGDSNLRTTGIENINKVLFSSKI